MSAWPEKCAVAPVFLSNHYHLLLWVPDARRLAAFMGYLNGNLAKEAGRIANWSGKFWGRRYQAIVASDEPEAQDARREYLLSHGVKEVLVRRPGDWSGVHVFSRTTFLLGEFRCRDL